MLRNLDEYKILNPYRINSDPLPDELSKQLRKIDYLSQASISMLCLPSSPPNSKRSENNLQRMAMAHEDQENKFQSIFGHSMLDLTEIEHEHYSHSEPPPTHPSYGQEAHSLKEDLHLHLYEEHSHMMHESLFESRGIGMG